MPALANWSGMNRGILANAVGPVMKNYGGPAYKDFLQSLADWYMTMGEFVEVYFRDKSQSLKDRSIKNKRDTMNGQLLPYFKDRPMNSITPEEIIQWQNTIIEKGY